MNRGIPWRSALFVPVNVDRFVDKAHLRGADAIVLDLEDSVVPAEKEGARGLIAAAAAKVSRNGADVIVRVNRPWPLAVRDLEAVAIPGVRAVMIPKVADAGDPRAVDEVLGDLESERGLVPGHIRIIAEIETAAALFHARDIARSCARVATVFVGGEDFALSTGMEPNEEGLLIPALQVALAVRAAGLTPMGFAGSIADFADLGAFRRMIDKARRLGFRGGFCIHPSQVAVLNEGFLPPRDSG